jgi:uncharacterized protein with GYD domain
MSTYILLVNYTDQGIRNIKDSPKRADAARKLAKTFGVEMKDIYLTMGGYDLVITMEAPSDDAVAKFALTVGATGNVRSTTLKAFTEKEYRGIIDDLP